MEEIDGGGAKNSMVMTTEPQRGSGTNEGEREFLKKEQNLHISLLAPMASITLKRPPHISKGLKTSMYMP